MGDDNGTIDDREHETERRGRMLSVGAAVTLTIGSFVTTSMFVGGSDASPIPAARVEAAAVAGSPYTSRVNARQDAHRVGCVDDLTPASLDAMFGRRTGTDPRPRQPARHRPRRRPPAVDVPRRFPRLHGYGTDRSHGSPTTCNSVAYRRARRLLPASSTRATRTSPPASRTATRSTTCCASSGRSAARSAPAESSTCSGRRCNRILHPAPFDGIRRHPIATWIGVYDPETFARSRSSAGRRTPACTRSTASPSSPHGRYSYLFGNSNQLNLAIEGGIDNGPFSATRMYLARVRTGPLPRRARVLHGHRLVAAPRPTPIRSRSATTTENTMQPRLIDGWWVSVTKKDGFLSAHRRLRRRRAPVGSVAHGVANVTSRPDHGESAGVVPTGPDAVADAPTATSS